MSMILSGLYGVLSIIITVLVGAVYGALYTISILCGLDTKYLHCRPPLYLSPPPHCLLCRHDVCDCDYVVDGILWVWKWDLGGS